VGAHGQFRDQFLLPVDQPVHACREHSVDVGIHAHPAVTIIYYLISLRVNGFSPDFDIKAHKSW